MIESSSTTTISAGGATIDPRRGTGDTGMSVLRSA